MISISIITCTYQAGDLLERTLRSVEEQKHPLVEHLIIDGCSTDHTAALVAAYRKRCEEDRNPHTIIWQSEPDKGLYDAMNKGLLLATGDYVLFLNAGDVFPSQDTLRQVAAVVGEDETLPGVLYGDTDVVALDGSFLHKRPLAPPARLSWHSFRKGMLVCHQAFYARTDLAKNNPYNLHYRFSADVDWCIRVMKAAHDKQLPLRNIDRVVVNYLDGGMTVKNHRASLKERFWIMSHHYGLLSTLIMHLWFIFRNKRK